MNILIVDDDAFDREHVKRSLRQSEGRFTVSEAKTADEGIQAYRDGHHDVILLDYLMPQKNGLSVLEELKDLLAQRKTAIVMMSAHEHENLALECLRKGAQDFLLKKEITATRLHRAILHAQTRFELESKLVESYQRAKQLAESDALTGLSNRYQFDELLKQAIRVHADVGRKLAVMMIDLDQFKYVNDYHGHGVGDDLLCRVASRFSQCMEANHTLARLGGDEFAVILEQVESVECAKRLAERLIYALSTEFSLSKAKVSISASIGIAMPEKANASLSSLLKQADIALYQAKHLGRNGYCVFEEAMEAQFAARYHLETRLKNALVHREFTMFYQPVFNDQHKITGFEALLRWFPEGEFCSPDEFIPVAEETGLINDIGEWVISQALNQLSLWQARTSKPLTMAINVSSIQLANRALVPHLCSVIAQTGVDPQCVEIELTETALLNDERVKVETIQGIHDLGCKISLDDFGTGFSSITHLRNFPIDIVKIDRSLMPQNDHDEKALGLINGVVLMIKAMKLSIVAEGVENSFHADLCQSLAIERAQGYHLARPAAVAQLEPLLFSALTAQ